MIGGNNYRWRGKNIRAIRNNGIYCVTMPRQDSEVIAPINMETESVYQIKVKACHRGGTGKINIGLKDYEGKKYKIDTIYIVSSIFKEFELIAYTDDIFNIANIYIERVDASGSILVESINCKEIERPLTPEDIFKLEIEEKNKEAIEKRLKEGAKQKEIEQLQRKKTSDEMLVSKGEKMPDIYIGGKGHRWRGKQIRSVVKHNDTCVELPRPTSVVLIPIKPISNSVFSVTIAASTTATSVPIFVNFFGGQKYDGTHGRLNVVGDKLKKYDIDLEVPIYPANTPMYLRIWRPHGSSGSIFIKNIVCSHTETKPKRKPKLPPAIPTKPKKVFKPSAPRLPKENNEMQFRPYDVVTKMTKKANKVLITRASQVPKVSIITPTRDGAELIKRCYEALNKNTAYPNWEWVVGDSNSEDDTVKYLKDIGDSRIKLIERGTTDGSFSSINNELVNYASGDYYLFLNNDTRPQPFWLYEMMSKIHNHAEIGAVGAKLMYTDTELQHAGIMFMDNGPANLSKPLMNLFGEDFIKQDRYYQAVTAACLLMRASDFRELDGFDTIYHFCYEDVDICLRIGRDLNKKILYAANALVYHDESITQKKHTTHGEKQRAGIEEFKRRWMNRVEKDFHTFRKNKQKNIKPIDITFVTCVNNLAQYRNYVVGSLFMSSSKKNYEIIPVMNFGNPYSAAQALNIGIKKARGETVVLCHQDIIFYDDWIDLLYKRIASIEESDKNWGVIGTAGITDRKDNTIGVVHNVAGTPQWQQTIKADTWPVQTVDEHCMIIRKNSGLVFDEQRFNGFHCYGPDICLNALSKKMKNYGILCPIIHESSSGSLVSGKKEFMRLLQALADKWRPKFPIIRTTTSQIKRKKIRTFIRFRN